MAGEHRIAPKLITHFIKGTKGHIVMQKLSGPCYDVLAKRASEHKVYWHHRVRCVTDEDAMQHEAELALAKIVKLHKIVWSPHHSRVPQSCVHN